MNKDLLKFKNEKKSKNPKFIRQDVKKRKRLSVEWRKPRGKDSKQRQMMQGRAIVKPGYGTPAELRGTNRAGKYLAVVSRKEDLASLDPKKHVVVISRRVGFRLKKELLVEVQKAKFDVQNLKNPEEYIKTRTEKLEARKSKQEEKSKKQEKVVKKKESIEDKLSDEEKKKIEKQEIDRLLTKKF